MNRKHDPEAYLNALADVRESEPMLKLLNSSPFYGALIGAFIPVRAPWQFFIWFLLGSILSHTLLELYFQRRKLEAFLKDNSPILEERIGLHPIPFSRKITFVLFGSGFWISFMCLLVWGVKWWLGLDIWTEKSVPNPGY